MSVVSSQISIFALCVLVMFSQADDAADLAAIKLLRANIQNYNNDFDIKIQESESFVNQVYREMLEQVTHIYSQL